MPKPREMLSESPEQTLAIGRAIGRALRSGDIVALFGDLGAGKTWLTKGIAEGLGVPSREVTSPTFVLMHIYDGRVPLAHFDAYRLEGADEMVALGAEEMFYGEGASVIEWADRVEEALPEDRLEIRLAVAGEAKRRLVFDSTGEQSELLLNRIEWP